MIAVAVAAYFVIGCLTAWAGTYIFPVAFWYGRNGPMLALAAVFWPGAWLAWLFLGYGNLLSAWLPTRPRKPDSDQPTP